MQLTEDRSHQAASYHGKYPELCKTNHSDSFWGPRRAKGFHSEDSHCLTPMCVGCVWDVMSWGQDPFPAVLGMVGVVVVILGSGSQTRDHKPGSAKSHREQEHKSPLGPCCSLWKRREELPLSRHRISELSYFSYSFLESPKKQLPHRSLS